MTLYLVTESFQIGLFFFFDKDQNSSIKIYLFIGRLQINRNTTLSLFHIHPSVTSSTHQLLISHETFRSYPKRDCIGLVTYGVLSNRTNHLFILYEVQVLKK